MHTGIPFRLIDYIELVDWTGKILRKGKARLNNQLPPILERLNLTQKDWLTVCTQLERKRALLVGCKKSFYRVLPQLQRSRVRGYQLN